MIQPPLSALAGRAKSLSRKASPARMRFAFGSISQSCSSSSAGVRFAAGQFEDRLLARRRGLLREITERGILLERDLPHIRRSLIENERKERRFPGAVRPDQPDPIATIHLERDVLEEDAPGERFGNLRNSQHRGKARTFGSPAESLKP